MIIEVTATFLIKEKILFEIIVLWAFYYAAYERRDMIMMKHS